MLFYKKTRIRKCRRAVKKQLKIIYAVIDAYLWMHGIGFARYTGCKVINALAYLLSLIMMLMHDSNIIYKMEMVYDSAIYNGIRFDLVKADLTYLFCYKVILILRLQLYYRRNKLARAWHELSKIYEKISKRKIFTYKIVMKVILLMMINDGYFIYMLVYFFKNQYFLEYNPLLDSSTFFFYEIFSIDVCDYLYLFSVILFYTFYPGGAVTAYLYIVCVLLEETLLELKQKFRNGNQDAEYLMHLYVKTYDVINNMNSLMRPLLLFHFIFLFCFMFFKGFIILIAYGFVLEDVPSVYVIHFLLMFFNFVLMCRFSAYVVNAMSALNQEAWKLSFPNMNSEKFQFVLRTNQKFAGFQLLDSVFLDSAFILTGVEIFITYGLLLMNFDIYSYTNVL